MLRYPRPLDAPLVARGHERFDAVCAKCHGTYALRGSETRAVYSESIIPTDYVGTDSGPRQRRHASVRGCRQRLLAHQGAHPRAQHRGLRPAGAHRYLARGLLATPGSGLSRKRWRRSPTKDRDGPSLTPRGAYDLDRVGVRYEVPHGERKRRPGEYVYDARQPGLDVGGHPFLANLAQDDRRAVIEYLKTL